MSSNTASTSSSANTGTTASLSANEKQNDVLSQSKDAQTMICVLKDMGIDEYEPKIVNQLLEFSYRYITNLLEDAKAFSNHASKKNIDSEDIKMAIKSKVDYSFTTTPPRDLLIDISKSKNKNPLPPIKFSAGIRLPPDRFCLHAPNYLLKSQDIDFTPVSFNHGQSSRQPFNSNPVMGTAGIRSDNTSYLTSAISIKRPRADEDDYDI